MLQISARFSIVAGDLSALLLWLPTAGAWLFADTWCTSGMSLAASVRMAADVGSAPTEGDSCFFQISASTMGGPAGVLMHSIEDGKEIDAIGALPEFMQLPRVRDPSCRASRLLNVSSVACRCPLGADATASHSGLPADFNLGQS